MIRQPNAQKDNLQAGLQIGLFSMVDPSDSQDIAEYSNAIGSLECIPRFIRGKVPQYLLSEAPEDTEVVNPYMNRGQAFNCHITPAQVRKKVKGKWLTYLVYPSDREELIERTLFTIAANKGLVKKSLAGMPARYGVEFSLYEIYGHLKSINKSRAYDVIKEALIVMRDCVTTITPADSNSGIELKTQVFADSALDVRGTGRSRERCFVTFNDYVLEQIVKLNYRQYSYRSIHQHKVNMGTFIHSWLCDNWKNCDTGAILPLDPELICQSYGRGRITYDEMKRLIRDGLRSLADLELITHVPRIKNGRYSIVATKKLKDEIKLANQKHKGLTVLCNSIKEGKVTALPNRNTFHLHHAG